MIRDLEESAARVKTDTPIRNHSSPKLQYLKPAPFKYSRGRILECPCTRQIDQGQDYRFGFTARWELYTAISEAR